MATFKVGQRVKLARSDNPNSKNIGMEGRIASLEHIPKEMIDWGDRPEPYDCDCTVLWDILDDYEYPQRTDTLEPIIPEGMQPAEWEECLWMPEHIKELVMT